MIGKKLKQFLTTDFPYLTTKEKIYMIALTGLYVSLFLLFFQPFGVNNYDPREHITSQFLLMTLLMGVVVSILISISEFIFFPRVAKRINGKNLVGWIIWSMLWLSSGVFLFYNYLGEWHDLSWTSYFGFVGNISILCLIPLTGILVYVRIRNLSQSLESAHAITYHGEGSDQLLTFKADNDKDQFTVPLKYIVYMEAEDNYVAIYHITHGTLSKTLVRKSLKRIQQENHHAALVRCHRSFIVNLVHLLEVKGNRTKLNVTLTHLKNPIPVSRQYLDDIYKLIPG